MEAIARQSADPFTHQVEIRGHRLTVDEPADQGVIAAKCPVHRSFKEK